MLVIVILNFVFTILYDLEIVLFASPIISCQCFSLFHFFSGMQVAKTSTKVTRSDKMKERQTSVDKLTKTNELIDLNKARHEVRQFGIKGFEGAKKEDAVLDMLVKLGAKV
jgi:hypothetical protein